MDDRKTQDAVFSNLEVLGEAGKKLAPEIRKAHLHLTWKQVIGLHDKVVHDYLGLNYNIF